MLYGRCAVINDAIYYWIQYIVTIIFISTIFFPIIKDCMINGLVNKTVIAQFNYTALKQRSVLFISARFS